MSGRVGYNGGIITNGLSLRLDAANRRSYSGYGDTWTDLSGNSNNGTLTNGPTFDISNGSSIVLDGTDDRILLPNTTTFGITNQFTIEVICKFTAMQNTSALNFCGSAWDRGINIHLPWSDGTFSFDVVNTNGIGGWSRWQLSNISYMLNITGIYTFRVNLAGNMSVFINNSLITPTSSQTFSGNVSLGVSNTVGDFYSTGGLPWKGNIYGLKVYNRALSDSEITQNYNAQKSRFGL